MNSSFMNIANRGPDQSSVKNYTRINSPSNFDVLLGFHRLAIIDPTPASNQPIEKHDCALICNGEIYNYKQIDSKFGFKPDGKVTKSDCEVIIDLYVHFGRGKSSEGVDLVLRELDGEFAFILYDLKLGKVVCARDQYGVRPLFIASSECVFCNRTFVTLASEAKGLMLNECSANETMPFKPGSYLCIEDGRMEPHVYHSGPLDSSTIDIFGSSYSKLKWSVCTHGINQLLTEAVNKRMQSDRPIGCLLSGGLDSSLICALAVHKYGSNMPVFTIGMMGSVDVEAAKKVAKYLNLTNHHVVIFDPTEGVDELENVIHSIESYDVTTVRASVPQFLLARYISTMTDVKVILTGEGADEIFGGYRYMRGCKTEAAFLNETEKLVKEIYMFDGLRTDRTMARFGLEVRVPFLDKTLVHYVFNYISPVDKMYSGYEKKIEKYILRYAFSTRVFKQIIPDDVLWRPKEAFSDAISSNVSDPTAKDLWMNILKTSIRTNKVTEEYYDFLKSNPGSMKAMCAGVNLPPTLEAFYYRNVFENIFPGQGRLISHYWMPNPDFVVEPFDGEWDPSATVICNR